MIVGGEVTLIVVLGVGGRPGGEGRVGEGEGLAGCGDLGCGLSEDGTDASGVWDQAEPVGVNEATYAHQCAGVLFDCLAQQRMNVGDSTGEVEQRGGVDRGDHHLVELPEGSTRPRIS
ncbi:MAG: hypothetical protein M3O70_13940 [Actinomycetota bacterium]|nr:hypothetical protein [Actinomycetota bacterium]